MLSLVYMFVCVLAFTIIVEILNPRVDDMLYICQETFLIFLQVKVRYAFFSFHTHILAYHE